ncbi:hypothetical protein HJFPF1_10653 [Paramyrothecium foliicola]|nr:hypothetical protein HJFPF1_10653 [Paramyrothecium foliicola]
MRFFTFAIAALHLGNALATPAPIPQAEDDTDVQHISITGKHVDGVLVHEHEPVEEGMEVRSLEKRGATVVVLGIAGTAAAVIVVKMAVEIGAETIQNLGKWNQAREEFTKKTTAEMWARNPDRNKYPAAVCYNKGYSIQHPNNIDGKADVDFKLGLLHTDYDCMYLGGNNAFWTHAEGGYINLSYSYNGNRCSFDSKTGDLTCR